MFRNRIPFYKATSNPAWYMLQKYDNTNPTLYADFANDRYAVPDSVANLRQASDLYSFSRASTATYYDASGILQTADINVPRFGYDPVTHTALGLLVEGIGTNLLLYSEDFSYAGWSKSNCSYTTNATIGPDGLSSGTLFTCTAATTSSVAQALSSNSGQTFTVFLKAGSVTTARVGLYDTAGTVWGSNSDGSTGEILHGPGVMSQVVGGLFSITGLSSTEWTKVRVYRETTCNRAYIYVTGGTAAVGDSIYVFGPQVELSSTYSSYIKTTASAVSRAADTNICIKKLVPTSQSSFLENMRMSSGTYFDSNGVMQTAAANVPRFDYDPVTHAAKGILVEESRTNLQKYSNDFSNAGWIKTRVSVTSNTFLAPDGTNTAFTLTEDTSSNTSHALQGAPITFSATSYTATAFLRSKERSWVVLRLGTPADNINAYFNIQTGTIGSKGAGTTSATITPLGNGWYRCSVTGNSSAVYEYPISIYPSTANGGVIYTGDGASGLYVWGAQVEQGSFPSSYIPTTSAAVTRAADYSIGFSDLYNHQGDGTLVTTCQPMGVGTTNVQPVVTLMNVFSSPRDIVGVYLDDNTANDPMVGKITTGGVTADLGSIDTLTTNTSKIALAYASGDSIIYKDAVAGTTGAPTAFGGYTGRINFGINNSMEPATPYFNGWIKDFKYYPKRITNAELQRITT